MVTIQVQGKSGETTGPVKAEARIEEVRLADLDRSLQVRASLNEEAIEDYRAMIEEGTELDPGIAYRLPDGRLALICGHHRAEAYRRAGRDSMRVEIKTGSATFAIAEGVRDNNKHRGVRLTSQDRRKVIEMILAQNPGLGDRMIAGIAGVHSDTVMRCRRRLETDGTIRNADSRVGADGREISTKRIGRKVNEEPTQAVEINQPPSLGSQPTDDHPAPESGGQPIDTAKEAPSALADPVADETDPGDGGSIEDVAPDNVPLQETTAEDSTDLETKPTETIAAPTVTFHIADDLQKRLDGLSEGEKAAWERHMQEHLDRGVSEADAGWRALADVRRDNDYRTAIPPADEEDDPSPFNAEDAGFFDDAIDDGTSDVDRELGVLRAIEAGLVEILTRVTSLRICQTGCLENSVRRARAELRNCRTLLMHAS